MRSQKNACRPGVEALDGRVLLASGVTAGIVGNVLTVQGTEAADLIEIRYRVIPPNPWGRGGGAMAQISIDGRPRFMATRFQGIVVRAGGGDDTVIIRQIGPYSLPTLIDGGAGNDRIFGGPGGETLYGNDGDDDIRGGGGPDLIAGGAGNDLINGVPEVDHLPALPPRPAPTPVQPTIVPAAQKVTPPPAPANDLAVLAQQVVDYTNAERQKRGLNPLRVNAALTRAAQLHAEAMAQADRMEHTLPGAVLPDLRSRAEHVGYSFRLLGENIAFNYRDASTLTYAWLSSPGHRDNMLHPDFVEVGVGIARNARGELYFAQVLGRP